MVRRLTECLSSEGRELEAEAVAGALGGIERAAFCGRRSGEGSSGTNERRGVLSVETHPWSVGARISTSRLLLEATLASVLEAAPRRRRGRFLYSDPQSCRTFCRKRSDGWDAQCGRASEDARRTMRDAGALAAVQRFALERGYLRSSAVMGFGSVDQDASRVCDRRMSGNKPAGARVTANALLASLLNDSDG